MCLIMTNDSYKYNVDLTSNIQNQMALNCTVLLSNLIRQFKLLPTKYTD